MSKQKKPIAEYGAYSVEYKNDAYILYHGSSVRQVFKTKQDALDYLDRVKK